MVTAAPMPCVCLGPMDATAVERAFAELLGALGDVVVGRTGGTPAHPAPGSTAMLVRRYRRRRRAFDDALDTLGAVEASGRPLHDEDAPAITNMRAALAWLDELEPTPGVRALPGATVDEDAAVARLRRRTYRAYGAATESVRVGGETIDRLTALARLATEPEAATRRTVFTAIEPIWRAVDGDGGDASPYRRLVRLSAERWARHGSPIEANAVALGMAHGSLEPTLREILAGWRDLVGPGSVEPWDYRFAVGAAARRLDDRIPADRLLDLNGRYLASLGADPDALGIRYDVRPRPGRPPVPVAFTIGMGGGSELPDRPGVWQPRPPRVFATYATGGLGNLSELVHESGHAIHMAAVRTRPAYLDWPMDAAAFLEGTADLLGWDVDEPAWQRRWLGDAADPREALMSRYGTVMLDVCWALFEIEMHRNPDRRPNDVWTELTADGLGIVPHPEWSWWAVRGQLIDSPGYLANYALSAIIAAAVRARIREVRGPWWTGDPGWYAFVSAGLFEAGASKAPSDLLRAFLGRSLTARPLLAELRGDPPATG
jgi:hypothetical protein